MEQMKLGLGTKRPKGAKYQLTCPFIIVCEGVSDRDFFRKFIEARGLPKLFDVPFPHDPEDASVEAEHKIAGGKTRFPQMLQASTTSDTAKAVLLMIDSADEIDKTVALAQKYIQDAKTGFGIPSKIMEVVSGKDAPAIAIATIPPGEPGGLETLCYRAVVSFRRDIADCIEKLCECAAMAGWTKENQDKARLQCAIAVLNKENPNGALRYVLRQEPPLIPLTDSAFDQVERLLREFIRLAS